MEKDNFYGRTVYIHQPNIVKEACYIFREYHKHELENNLNNCAVTKDEFDKALRILLAFSFETSNENTFAKFYKCNPDCENYQGMNGFCAGEFQTNSGSKELCKHYKPYYDDELFAKFTK